MTDSPILRKVLQAPDKSLTMNKWTNHTETVLRGVLARLAPPVMEGSGWYQKFHAQMAAACQPQELALLSRYTMQTLCAKVKAFYESTGKENSGVPRSAGYDQQMSQAASYTPSKRPMQPSSYGDVLSGLIQPPGKVLNYNPSTAASSDHMFGGGAALAEGVGGAAGVSAAQCADVTAECALTYVAQTFRTASGQKFLIILLVDPPQCHKLDISNNVIDENTFEVTFKQSNLMIEDARRAVDFVIQQVDRDNPNPTDINTAFTNIANAVNAKRSFVCKFRVAFKIDASRMMFINTELNMQGEPHGKTKAVYVLVPELQELATLNFQRLDFH